METAISVKKLYIRYEPVQKSSIFTLFRKRKRAKVVKALRKVTFDVPKGEIIGIVGSNGSGKSTLLRVIAGLMAPDIGSVNLHGNSVSLLSLGTGFVADLSGRDNIMLSGLAMGFSRKEIQEKFDAIVSFSELGDAIDRPVRTYSSGMYSKLAFSVAMTLHTDILLIDEVLSVGDQRFRTKSRNALTHLIQDKSRTVMIVSHNMMEIKNLCTRVLWLEMGRIRAFGDTEEVLEAYNRSLAEDPNNVSFLEPPVLQVEPQADKIILRWAPVKHAEDYRIYRREAIADSQWSWVEDGFKGTYYEDVPPSRELAYWYTVRARTTNKAGNVWSDSRPAILAKLTAPKPEQGES